MRTKVVFYFLIAPAVLRIQVATFVDPDLKQLGVRCLRSASNIHILFVFHTVGVRQKYFNVLVLNRVKIRVLATHLKRQFSRFCVELIIGYRACQNLHSRNFRAWNL